MTSYLCPSVSYDTIAPLETGVSISVFNLKHISKFVDIQNYLTLVKLKLISMCCFNLIVFVH